MKLVDDSCSEAVDARMACFDALCAQLTGVDESLAVPYRVLSAMTAMKDVMVILLSRCTALLKERIEKSVKVVEEKTIDPAIEARLAAERAKEEAEMYLGHVLKEVEEKTPQLQQQQVEYQQMVNSQQRLNRMYTEISKYVNCGGVGGLTVV